MAKIYSNLINLLPAGCSKLSAKCGVKSKFASIFLAISKFIKNQCR